MKSVRYVLFAVVVFAAAAFAQSDAQKSFDQLKTLAGSWDGVVRTNPPSPEIDGKHVQATLRVTSMGNALMHEMKERRQAGRSDHDALHG